MPCHCGNTEFGFNCVCDWIEENPGSKSFRCNYCGIYSAGSPRCNHCEEFENNYIDTQDVCLNQDKDNALSPQSTQNKVNYDRSISQRCT